jgi:hypothetical protein
MKKRGGPLFEQALPVILGRKTLRKPMRQMCCLPAIEVEDWPLGHVLANAMPIQRRFPADVQALEPMLQ